MEKSQYLFRRVEIKFKLFEFYLVGNLDDCGACIKILNALDLDEHGIQFLCLKEDGVSPHPGKPHLGDIALAGLLEVKKGTTVGELEMFFRTLDAPFWDCVSLVSLCEDVNSWLNSCFIKKGRPLGINLKKGGVVMKKGTLTIPAHAKPSSITLEKEGGVMKKLPARKRTRSRWD